MADFLIPTPTEIAIGNYKGTHIARSKNSAYTPQEIYALAKEDFTSWWAIGMAFYLDNVLQVIVVSNNDKQACVQSKNFTNPGNTIEFLYGNKTYYYSAIALDIADDYIDTSETIIPVYSSAELSITSYEDAALELISLYSENGGILPGGVNYPTSWVQRLIEGAWQKTFAFAHAKTVYTDYANKKTLADKLSEIDTEIGNKANKTEIPTELPANGGNSATVNGHTVKSDVPENAVFTDTVYDDTEVQKSISQQSTEIMSIKNTANFSHNIPRNVPKDITSYITDGTFYKRLNGTDGFELFEDIYVGDYIKMSRAITCPDSSGGTVGSQYVTIAGLDTMMNNGEDGKYVNYHHAVMVPGKGFEGIQHFGRHAMNATNTTEGGYAGSVMDQSVLGAVVTEGSTASGATINQQLYAEFGSHLKTTDELLSISINATGTNRFGTANGCSNNWAWAMRQAVLMSEVEVYGCTVWSSSGYDTGNAKMQLPLFAHSRNAMNDRGVWYWLKDAASSTRFCLCVDYGYAGYSDAGYTWGCVRPRFIIAA